MSYHDPGQGGASDDKKLIEIISGFHAVIGDQVAEVVNERDQLRARLQEAEDQVLEMSALVHKLQGHMDKGCAP